MQRRENRSPSLYPRGRRRRGAAGVRVNQETVPRQRCRESQPCAHGLSRIASMMPFAAGWSAAPVSLVFWGVHSLGSSTPNCPPRSWRVDHKRTKWRRRAASRHRQTARMCLSQRRHRPPHSRQCLLRAACRPDGIFWLISRHARHGGGDPSDQRTDQRHSEMMQPE